MRTLQGIEWHNLHVWGVREDCEGTSDVKKPQNRWKGRAEAETSALSLHTNSRQAPIQLNSLTGTYATSTYLAALKKSPKDLDALAKDVAAFDKRIKEDEKIRQFIRE